MNYPKWLREAEADVAPPPTDDSPNILIFDIETTPEANWTWSRYQTNTIGNLRPWHMLSFVYKWHGDDQVHFVGQSGDPDYRPDHPYRKPRARQDRWVVARLWQLFDKADVLVAHNGDRFDVKKANARFMFYGLNPPSPYRTIDTLKETRRYAKFESNRLDDLSRHLLNDQKAAHMGMTTWFGCMFGDDEQWARMEAYNRQDVLLLEELYDLLLPWIGSPGKANPGVNAAAWGAIECPKPGCGGRHLVSRGYQTTAAGLRYRKLQCKRCGGWCTAKYAERDHRRVMVK